MSLFPLWVQAWNQTCPVFSWQHYVLFFSEHQKEIDPVIPLWIFNYTFPTQHIYGVRSEQVLFLLWHWYAVLHLLQCCKETKAKCMFLHYFAVQVLQTSVLMRHFNYQNLCQPVSYYSGATLFICNVTQWARPSPSRGFFIFLTYFSPAALFVVVCSCACFLAVSRWVRASREIARNGMLGHS